LKDINEQMDMIRTSHRYIFATLIVENPEFLNKYKSKLLNLEKIIGLFNQYPYYILSFFGLETNFSLEKFQHYPLKNHSGAVLRVRVCARIKRKCHFFKFLKMTNIITLKSTKNDTKISWHTALQMIEIDSSE